MRILTLLTVTLLAMILLNSCVIWKFDTLLTERNRQDVPDISGGYVDSQGQPVTITKTEFSNTFLVKPPSGQAEVRLSMENIAPNRYLVQAKMSEVTPGMPPFIISVAEIVGNNITVYFFLNLDEKIREMAKSHQVTYELIGFKEDANKDEITGALEVLTAYDSVDGLIAFFNELFTLEGSQKVVITKR
ncbi:MAG: hypothetical protein LBE80_08700 [Deltaproteobacteria bacterium]|jgi:hypothetical protein|nr:hypothetical protein [Deltaproteobacteria bacterium]